MVEESTKATEGALVTDRNSSDELVVCSAGSSAWTRIAQSENNSHYLTTADHELVWVFGGIEKPRLSFHITPNYDNTCRLH